MERDEIIRMAREAGMDIDDEASGFGAIITAEPIDLERFADLVAEPWIETNKALAKEIIELQKQAEQEPVRKCDGLLCNDCGEYKQRYKDLPGLTEKDLCVCDQAAPVRTKDLTDDEIMKINVDTAGIVPTCDRQFHFARAVIAAYKEKNK